MIGVVIPVYKRKKCLIKTLRSLTLQTKQSFYVVIVDDHSPEPLKDTVMSFSNELHIKYIYLEKNVGPGLARQAGLEYCYKQNFEFVLFLDSDDFLFPHALAKLNYEINKTSSDIVSSEIHIEDNYCLRKNFLASNKTFVHGKMYRTNFLKQNNITFPSLRTNEDLAFNLKAFGSTDKVALINEPLHVFHNEPNSITRCGKNSLNLEIDYIEAIYDAATYLKENRNINNEMILNIFNCYNCYQTALLLGGKFSTEQTKHLKWLLALQEFREGLNNKKNLSLLPEIIQQVVLIDNNLKQFKQSFEEWLEENGHVDNCD